MAREVTHEATGPRIVDEDDIDEEKGDVAICMCGLSPEYPFCDGTHEVTADEDPDTRYRYEREDGELRRRAISRIVYADDPDDGESESES